MVQRRKLFEIRFNDENVMKRKPCKRNKKMVCVQPFTVYSRKKKRYGKNLLSVGSNF